MFPFEHTPPVEQEQDVKVITKRMTDTSIREREDDKIVFPPGITLDEELLILAGAEDWRMTDPVEPPPSPPMFPSPPPSAVDMDISPSEYAPSPPRSLPPSPSVDLGDIDAVKESCKWMLDGVYDSLSDAELPKVDKSVMMALCTWISDEMLKRYERHLVPALPPKNHVYYPYWVPDHEVNKALDNAKMMVEGKDVWERDDVEMEL